MEKMIWIKQVRGSQQTIPAQKKTLKALGLNGIGAENSIKDSRSVRGMVTSVQHMVVADLVEKAPKKAEKKDNRGYTLG